jgi:phage terminase large subunit-like protein
MKKKPTASPRDPVSDYARRVLDGEVPSCHWVRLACERHFRDLESGNWIWDTAEVQRRLDFFGHLTLFDGRFSGESFELHESQQFVLGSIYGWRNEDGTRRYRYAYIEIPRKNGKTTLLSGVGIQELMAENGAQVYSVATKEDQAKISWKMGQKMIEKSDHLRRRLTLRVKETRFELRDGSWRPLGSDSNTLDGLNPSCALFDELHAWPARDLWDVIDDGLGSRDQPLVLQITTAGYNKFSICYEQRKHVCSILEGKDGYVDDRYFGIIFTVDDPNDWGNENEWRKANPMLDVCKSMDFMRDQYRLAVQQVGKENAFKNKQLNIWTEAALRWLKMDRWDAGGAEEFDPSVLRGRTCYGGLDLARVSDLSSLQLYFPARDESEKAHVLSWFWCPDENIRERSRRDRVPYVQWANEGLITPTDGDTTDFRFIGAEILDLAKLYDIQEIAYDRTFAGELIRDLTEEGITMVPFGQGFISMGSPSAELERLVVSGKLLHNNHPILRWNAANAVTSTDPAGNIKPDKKKAQERIDGIVALIMAIGRASVHTPITSVYKTRGLLSV